MSRRFAVAPAGYVDEIVKLSSKPKTERRKQEIRKRAYVIILIHHPPPTPQLFKTDK